MKYEDDYFYSKLFNIQSYDGLDDKDEEVDYSKMNHEDFEHTPRSGNA